MTLKRGLHSTKNAKQVSPTTPKTPPSTAEMLAVSRLFYVDNLTKEEIAKRRKTNSKRIRWGPSDDNEWGVAPVRRVLGQAS